MGTGVIRVLSKANDAAKVANNGIAEVKKQERKERRR